jgi:hypothetical protein
VRPEGLSKVKKFTLLGIEPATFRFVALCFNHYATAWPIYYKAEFNIYVVCERYDSVRV